ncbi:HlyD family type I secretion periplasmic adaptor subunit [Rhodoblastus sp.]|uniref:HlyD family type I secretion periplasmic adaptor subunit n=1 Tax=Rhodoblastus sp. TaxID=1962975 RepID=UPI0035AE8AA8
MNATASELKEDAPHAQGAKRELPFVADREFLPADLEILETPPSPVRMALILTICALVVVALAWSWIGRIDIVAVAQGKIQPTGRVKVIQPLETSKVAAIKVENGQHVAAGQVLLALDSGDAHAEEADARGAYDSYRAETQRRRVALEAARSRALTPPPQIAWDADIPLAIQTREDQVLAGELEQLSDNAASLDAQIRQKEIERDRLTETMAAQEKLVATLQERVDMRSSLVKSGSGAKSAVIDAEESAQYHLTQLALQKSQRDAAKANLDVLAHERDKAFSNFIADNAQKLAEAQRQADEWREKLAKAKLKSARMSLASPIDGTVYGLSVTTIGQVVGGGEELMRIVPEGAALEIECYLANKDIGFVKPGQKAVVKIESFPFTRYGALQATVERVASDAIPEPEAQQLEGDATRAPRDKTFAGAQRTQNLVFPVTLTPARKVMDVDGQEIPLTPGMAVSVEIATGNRRILEYIFSPLVETASRAMKER